MKKSSLYTLSSQTLNHISQTVGTDLATLQTMDNDQVTALIEKKLGQKLRYQRNTKIDAYLVGKDIDDVDRRLTEITTSL